MECPRCHQIAMSFDWSIGTMRCPGCGYRLYADDRPAAPAESPPIAPPASQPSPAVYTPAFTVNPLLPEVQTVISQATAVMPAAAPPSTPRPPVKFDPPGGLDMDALPEYLDDYGKVRMRGRLRAAMYALARGNPDEIRQALHEVIEISPDHADTWLYLAAMAADATEQRRCLEQVIAARPGDPTAMHVMAQLDGLLDETVPAPPARKLAEGQVAAERLVCPQCGGNLTYHEATREVTCAYCGYHIVDADDLARTDRHSTVLEGNVRRKQQAANWNIGQKWLRCGECGAITTLSRSTLTNTCRFCQSRHVVQESVNNRFEQPDLIVPFTVDEQAARVAIDAYLTSGLRRITRLFADEVDRIELHGSYLPFWVFDADMVVNWSWSNAPAHGKYPILLSDELYLAAPTPPRDLLEKIEPFDLRRGVDYDPRLLAVYPAQLYDTDMTRASIDVRTRLTHNAIRKAMPSLRMNRPHGYGTVGSSNDPGRLETNAYTQFLTYRLALLPVWAGRLVEEDGDTKQVLVNGQTGTVALGKLQKAGA